MDLSRVKLYLAVTALIVAVGSLACGMVGFFHHRYALFDTAMWCSAFALLLGSVTFLIPLRGPMVPRPSFYAVGAIILSLPLVGLLATTRFTVWSRQKFEREHTLVHNMKLLHKSLQRYVKANDGCLPDANSWADSLMQEDPSLDLNAFRHPEDHGVCVSYNVNLSGLELSNISQDVVLFFTAEGGHNLAGAQELLDSLANTLTVHIMLLDGTIKDYWPEHRGVRAYGQKFMSVRWTP